MTETLLETGLEVEALTVAFGGNVAVRDVSFAADLGVVTGLIGPNGAGKTTTFNACNGLLRPSSGRIRLMGSEVTRVGTAGRARRGLGRTFQRVEVCNGMTVRENVALGREAVAAGSNPWRQMVAGRSGARVVQDATNEALERCGIEDLAGQPVALLSTGQRRLVELARVMAGGFRFLLLDEPSSGLDEAETRRFGRAVSQIVADGDRGVLLVEHDMSLVMGICQRLYVLDFGSLVFVGTPAEVQASSVVRAAYLGEEAS